MISMVDSICVVIGLSGMVISLSIIARIYIMKQEGENKND